jgi:transcription termination factor Rho
VNLAELETRNLEELKELARDLGMVGISGLKKQDLIFKLLQAQTFLAPVFSKLWRTVLASFARIAFYPA